MIAVFGEQKEDDAGMIKIPKEMKSVIKTEIKANFDAEVKIVKEEMNKKYEREIKR